MELRRQPRDFAARGVAMQLALARSLIQRADSGAEFLLRGSRVGRGNRFGRGLDRGTDLRSRGAIMFSALEVLPVALLC